MFSAAPASPQAKDAEGEAFFEKRIRPLLVERCYECHGGPKVKAHLQLTSRTAILKGGDSGPAAVPGKPDQSLLIQVVRYQDTPQMPPKGKLKEEDIAALVQWVQRGLPWPERKLEATAAAGRGFQITDEQRRFWSFQPVQDPPPPAFKDSSWPRAAIDRFILAALEPKGLAPAAPADKRTLIRRATFDLTGLPPTPEEIEAFLRDESPDAFARVVDRLLNSPHYGERWARHWLDVVRYTDSFDARITTGPGQEMDISEAWRYRDWVVAAFNRDLPYDRFVIDQVAGDLLPAPQSDGINADGITATGFLAIGNWGGGDADKEKLLTDIADDQVDVVSRTFLGLTLACARCHDHKFDPLSTADYYGMAGIFFSTHILPNVGPKTNGPPMLRIPLASKTELAKRNQQLARIAETEKKFKAARDPLGAALLRGQLEVLKRSLPPVTVVHGAQEGGVPGSPHAGAHDVRVHIRGSYARLGELVPRHVPTILAGERQKAITQGSGRLELARWLASPDNPLTARVMVNRIWQHHFGEGLVRTPSNFGKLGERPTHPELLDYLARRFIESGWSVKAVHRAIMLTAVYQQSSSADSWLDPDNYLLARMSRRRLEAEAIRDSLLAVSGRLDPRLGGPATREFASPRRTLYQMTVRSDRAGFGPLFDAADPTALVDRRTQSTVAPQALFLLNHPFVLDQASALAQRIQGEGSQSDAGRIRRAYGFLYGRPPTRAEVAVGEEFLADSMTKGKRPETAWLEYVHLLLCANEFIYID